MPTIGTATVGYGSVLAIDDQGAGLTGNGTFVNVVNVLSYKEPAPELGMVDSKTLDISNRTFNRIPGIHDPGAGTLVWEFVNANTTGNGTRGQWDRFVALQASVAGHSFRFSTVLANGTVSNVTSTLFVTKNEKSDVVVDGKTEVTTTLSATGASTFA